MLLGASPFHFRIETPSCDMLLSQLRRSLHKADSRGESLKDVANADVDKI